jgi:hypothetical protein
MKKTLTKAVLLVSAIFLTVGTVLAKPEAYFHQIHCPNGYNNAYMVTIIELDTGCLISCWGRDCTGREYTMQTSVTPVTGEPTDPYTYMDTGTATNGSPFYVKIQTNADGEVTKAWGKNASGAYYIAEFSN